MTTSFQNAKALKFIITLDIGFGSFPGGNQILTIEGLRASVHVDFAGGYIMPWLNASIYGVTQSDMNATTTLAWNPKSPLPQSNITKNTIAVYAIDGQQETQVFFGNIVQAWGIYAGMPEVYLMVQAQGAYASQLTPIPRITLTSDTTIESVMTQLASKMGMNFENNGVTGTVRTGQTLHGSPVEMVNQMASAYRNQFTRYYDVSNGNILTIGTLAITPPNTPRRGITPIISPQTGLMNYPFFFGQGQGVQFDTLFNPGIKAGGAVQIQSSLPKATGTFYVGSVSHDLESQTPGGRWQSTVQAWFSQGNLISSAQI